MKYLNYLLNVNYIKVIFRLSDNGYLNLIIVLFFCIFVFVILRGLYMLSRLYIYFLVHRSILSHFVVNELDIKYKYIKQLCIIIGFIFITIMFLAILLFFF